MKKLSILVLLVSLIFVSEVNAAEQGPYIGAGGQHAWENFQNVPSDVNVDDSWGLNFRAGYQLNRYLAIEANYDWYDGFDWKFNHNNYYDNNLDVKLEVQTLLFDLKAMYPIKNFVPYVRVGGGWMWANFDVRNSYYNSHYESDTFDDFAWDVGGGFSVYLTPNICIGPSFRYVMGTGDVDNIRYSTLGFGLEFHF
jgi:opacity protein-like surface antigen